MRLIAQGKDPLEGQRHMCGMGNMFHYHSTGFPELDELMRTPQPLIFIMELLQVSASTVCRLKTLASCLCEEDEASAGPSCDSDFTTSIFENAGFDTVNESEVPVCWSPWTLK